MADAPSIVAISAGLSVPSSTSMLARSLAERTGAEFELVELRELAKDLLNAQLTRVASPQLQAVLDQVARADAVIAVTPVYNASFSALFKLFFEVLDEGALAGTPVLLGATGGTARHSLAIQQAMVPLFFYLKANLVPTTVFAATDDWGSAGLDARITAAADDLVGRLSGAASRPPARTVDDDFALEQDFEAMLRNI